MKTRHDLGSWSTPANELNKILALSKSKRFIDAKKRGYIDIQMLWKTFKQVPTFSFGAGEKNVSHKENEFVKISNLTEAEKFYRKLIVNNFSK